MATGTDSTTRLDEVVAAALDTVRRRDVRPGATYRLQFHNGLSFARAADLAPYLRDLGITHLYASPILQARPGSTHGYDLCDHGRFDESLGGEAGFQTLVEGLRAAGLGLVLDIVPNHMSTHTGNGWWRDVLENGPASPFARYFDIDWSPVKIELTGKVLLPLLGQQYGEALESGQLQIEHADGEFWLRYYDNRLPLGPKTTIPLLTHGIDELAAQLGPQHEHLVELQSIVTALEHLPPQTATSPEKIIERQREKEVIKRRLRELEAASPDVHAFVARNVQGINGHPDEPSSWDRLDDLLARQPYRLCHWRAAADEINYRRFFDVNELAAVVMENPEVFHGAHHLVVDQLAAGAVDGLRIDHIDGLFAPEQYLWRLQWAYLAGVLRRAWVDCGAPWVAVGEEDGAVDAPTPPRDENEAWAQLGPGLLGHLCKRMNLPRPDGDDLRAIFGSSVAVPQPLDADESSSEANGAGSAPPAAPGTAPPLLVLVEKILGPNEPLPANWPVAGTTGYDFGHECTGLFIEPAGFEELRRHYQRITGDPRDFDQVARECKRLILRVSMASELQMLAHELNRISEQHRRTRDFTLNMLRLALREVLVYFPVYRVYPSAQGMGERERRFVQLAVAWARRRNPAMDRAVFDFIRDVLLMDHPPGITDQQRAQRELFAGRFQQVTSPVMAKGVEDTAFYAYVPLVSANEVGGDPRAPAMGPATFHAQNAARAAQYPGTMLASSTHDSKRTEDVRARLNVLSELPGVWRRRVARWFRLNRRHHIDLDGQPAPSRVDEYLFYQSLLGIWPLTRPDRAAHAALVRRLQAYMEKATHEAKQHTSWISPDERYDAAVRDFVAGALDIGRSNKFLADFQEFHEQIAPWGLIGSLAQLTLKLASPGFPDIYQGQEIWDFSLVDPDNRRPVDFSLVGGLLSEIRKRCADRAGLATLSRELADDPRDLRTKLFVTWRLLDLRTRHPRLFAEGDYAACETTGRGGGHVVAFVRRLAAAEDQPPADLLVVVPRCPARYAALRGRDPLAQPARPWSHEFWDETRVRLAAGPRGEVVNVFTGATHLLAEETMVGDLLSTFPIGVFVASMPPR